MEGIFDVFGCLSLRFRVLKLDLGVGWVRGVD